MHRGLFSVLSGTIDLQATPKDSHGLFQSQVKPLMSMPSQWQDKFISVYVKPLMSMPSHKAAQAYFIF